MRKALPTAKNEGCRPETEAEFEKQFTKRGCEKSDRPNGKKQKVPLTFEKRQGGTFCGIMFL